MRTVKRAAIVLAAGVLLPVLAWGGTFFYWHFRIRSAIRVFEAQTGPTLTGSLRLVADQAPMETLLSAGCRSLPYLAREIGTARNPELLFDAFEGNLRLALQSDPRSVDVARLLNRWEHFAEDTPQERRQKATEIRSWWDQNGHLYHQWWRVWTWKCRS